jgi:hypothetical protein
VLSATECIAISGMLANHGRPWPAVPLHRKIVAADPENVSSRLNLAGILARVKQNDEAERNVHYIIDQPHPRLSSYGFYVAYNTLSRTAENRDQWKDAFDLHSRALSYNPNFAAESGDVGSAALRECISLHA